MPPILVGSGGFRVDRDRAIEVLRGFQLPDPRDFLAPWLRFAAASKATNVTAYSRLGGLDVEFDGTPIQRARLEDPYESLFGETDRSPDLVSGLLGALRLRPRRVTIYSGQSRLTIDRFDRQTLEALEKPFTGTSVEVRWKGWFTGRLTRECLRRARAARKQIPIPLWIDGKSA